MLSCIVCVDNNNAIGLNNKLLVNISEDMKHFKDITLNKNVIMGRKTFESLPNKNRPLKDRKNIVLTNNPKDFIKKYGQDSGVLLVNNIHESTYMSMMNLKKEFIVIGGSSIYKIFMPYIQKIYMTQVLETFEADSFFDYNESDFEITDVSDLKIDLKTGLKYYFKTLEKK